MKINAFILFVVLSLSVQSVAAIDLVNITVPDFNNGEFTRYWYHEQQDFDGFGFAYGLIAPFTSLFGPWFFAIIWSAMIYRSYDKTGTITMPITLGILTGTVWGVVMPTESITIWTILLVIGIAAIVVKYLVERP